MLIVDDEPMAGRALAGILRGEGLRVHVIEDAELALELVRLLPIDLLLVDVTLPGMSGLDFLRVLRRAGVTTPAILVSGAPTDELAAGAGEEAPRSDGSRTPLASAWLPKPVDRATLLQTIEEVVARRSSLPPA